MLQRVFNPNVDVETRLIRMLSGGVDEDAFDGLIDLHLPPSNTRRKTLSRRS